MTRQEALQALNTPRFGDQVCIDAQRLLERAERYRDGERLDPWEITGDVLVAALEAK